ncbi:MAG: hypothetical protein P4N60_08035 [Verrucomicrobiae bacterium]|nr:hypothetical protein [Verrucomicrobiae bacterium]
MKTNFDNLALAASQRVYGWLLRAYPPGHRAEYGPAMAQLFRDQGRDAWSEARARGLLKLWLRVLPDLVSTSVRERLAVLKERKSLGDKLTNLSGGEISPGKFFSRVFVVVFLSIFIGSAAVTFLLPNSYASTTKLLLNYARGDKKPVDPKLLEAQMDSLNSDAVLVPVIDQLGLKTRWEKKYHAGKPLTTGEALIMLRQRVVLKPSRDHMVVAITTVADDRAGAVELAKAIVRSYRDYRVGRSQAKEDETAWKANGWLAALREQEEQVKAARQEVEMLGQQLGVSKDATGQRSSAEEPYWDAKHKLDELVVTHAAQQKRLKEHLFQLQALPPDAVFSYVPIIQEASLQTTELRPNRSRNIVMGGFWGIFAAALAGGAMALVVWLVRKWKQARPVSA